MKRTKANELAALTYTEMLALLDELGASVCVIAFPDYTYDTLAYDYDTIRDIEMGAIDDTPIAFEGAIGGEYWEFNGKKVPVILMGGNNSGYLDHTQLREVLLA